MDGERARAIRMYIEEVMAGDGDGCAPTVEQIAGEFEESVSAIRALLIRMSGMNGLGARSVGERERYERHRPRSGLAGRAAMPPIMGTVGAGDEEYTLVKGLDDTYATLADVLGGRDGAFAMQVKGQSMIGIGIQENDWALFQPVSHYESGVPTEVLDGDIVLVEVLRQAGEHGLLLKRVFRMPGGWIRLESCNEDYEPRIFRDSELRVNSKLISWVRVFRHGNAS